MPDFNRVVIRNRTEPMGTRHRESFDSDEVFVYQGGNVHIAVHPFPTNGRLISMYRQGQYSSSYDEYEMPEYQMRLADALWEQIPGLNHLFFGNGEITLQHHIVFTDDEVFEAAETIIRPILEQNLMLMNLTKEL